MTVVEATFKFRGWTFTFIPKKRRPKKSKDGMRPKSWTYKVNVQHGKKVHKFYVFLWHPTACICRRIRKKAMELERLNP